MRLKAHHWAIAGALSASVHALAFLKTGAPDRIAAGPAAGSPAAVWGIAASEMVETVEPARKQDDVLKPLRKLETPAKAVAEEARAVAQDETIEDARPLERVEPVKEKPVEEKKEEKKKEAQRRKASQGGPVGQRVGNAGTRRNSVASRAATASYSARILSHLRRHKRHPGGGARGTVNLVFTVGSNGALRSVRVTGGSASPSLRNAALAMVRRASPFPSFPQGMGRSSMTFSVPVRFSP